MVEDIKMNAFQEVEDYEYIYVELADGSQANLDINHDLYASGI